LPRIQLTRLFFTREKSRSIVVASFLPEARLGNRGSVPRPHGTFTLTSFPPGPTFRFH
jgi:hypothetical protein